MEFADTDVAGIMHFSNFFRFMEECEHAFLRSLGLLVHPLSHESGDEGAASNVGWPRVHASCDFKKSLKFEEEVEIELLIDEIGKRTIGYSFNFWKNPDDQEERTLAASGKITVLCVHWDEASRKMKAAEIPSEIREKLEGIRTA